MTTYGVVPTGFETKTLDVIQSEIEADQLANIDPGLDLSANTPLGQMNAIVAKKVAEVWELADAVYNSVDPDTNEGAAQDGTAAITGTIRETPKYSTVDCTLTFSAAPPGNVLAAGARVQVLGQPLNTWTLVDDVDVTAAGSYAASFRSETYGPNVANAGTMTVILTPTSGWSSVTNPLDAELGALVESDTVLRARREDEIDKLGGSTLQAVRNAVMEIDGVKQCIVYENATDVIDTYERPPHSIEVLIYDDSSDDDDIAKAIWAEKPAGIATAANNVYGTAVVTTVRDELRGLHDVYFTRVLKINLYLNITVLVNAENFPVDGVTRLKEALVAYSLVQQNMGVPFYTQNYISTALTVAGVETVTSIQVDDTTPLTTFPFINYPITVRQIAVLDTGRISVTVTNDSNPPPPLP